MAKASSLCSLHVLQPSIRSSCSRRPHIMQVRAQSLDEGRSRNIVDANLSVLREKMEVIKMRERLEKCCNNKHQQCGWNYAAGYNYKLRRAREVSTFFELMQLVCVTVGATCFTATLCLVLVSLLVNLNQ
ncbi:unnamed protein product [Prunus armeniaca]